MEAIIPNCSIFKAEPRARVEAHKKIALQGIPFINPSFKLRHLVNANIKHPIIAGNAVPRALTCENTSGHMPVTNQSKTTIAKIVKVKPPSTIFQLFASNYTLLKSYCSFKLKDNKIKAITASNKPIGKLYFM